VNRSLAPSVLALAQAGLTLALFGCGGAPLDAGVDPCRCDDGLYCNGTETCDNAGACLAGVAPVPVDDGDPCTRSTVCDESADTARSVTSLRTPF
jgi:hypothetical protein